MAAPRYYTVSWDQLHRDSKALAWRLVERGPFRGVVAITRGGLIPAAVVARELECRVIETVSVVTYDEEKRGEPRVVKPPAAAGDGEGWLIISDIAEHLGLRSRQQLLDWIAAGGLRVIDRLDTRPKHPKAQDAGDPLHAARAAEVTSLWRLARADGIK